MIEKGLYKAAVDEAKAGVAKAEATLKLAELEVDRQTELVQRNVCGAGEARRRRSAKRAKRTATVLAQTGRAREGASCNSATPTSGADRRAHRPRQRLGRQFRRPVERHARDHRQPGPDLRQLSGDAARNARPAQERKPANPADVRGLSPARRRQPLRQARQDQFPRRHGEPGHRHGAGARDLSQSRPHPGRRPARRGRGGGRQGASASCWCRSRRCSSTRPAPSCWSSTRTTRSRSAASRSAVRAAPA